MPNKKGNGWNPLAKTSSKTPVDDRRRQPSSRPSGTPRGSADNRRRTPPCPSGSRPSGQSKSGKPKFPLSLLTPDQFQNLLEPTGPGITTQSAFVSEVSSTEKELYFRVMCFFSLQSTPLASENSNVYYPAAIKFKPQSLLAPFATELKVPPQVVSMKLFASAPAESVTVLYGLPVRSGSADSDPAEPPVVVVATRSTNFLGGSAGVVNDQRWTEVGGFSMDTLHLTTAQLLRVAANLHLGTIALVSPFNGAPSDHAMTFRAEILLKQALPTLVVALCQPISGDGADPNVAWNSLPEGSTDPNPRPGQITSIAVRRTE